MGQQGPPGAKKKTFFQNDPGPHWNAWNAQTSVSVARFEAVVAHFGPVVALRKPKNALKKGRLVTKNGSKMGQTCVFPKKILDHLGCPNK